MQYVAPDFIHDKHGSIRVKFGREIHFLAVLDVMMQALKEAGIPFKLELSADLQDRFLRARGVINPYVQNNRVHAVFVIALDDKVVETLGVASHAQVEGLDLSTAVVSELGARPQKRLFVPVEAALREFGGMLEVRNFTSAELEYTEVLAGEKTTARELSNYMKAVEKLSKVMPVSSINSFVQMLSNNERRESVMDVVQDVSDLFSEEMAHLPAM